MKRKGEEFASTPPLSVVVPENDNEETSDSISSFTLPTSKTWEATHDAMKQLMDRYNSNDKKIALINETNNSIEMTEEKEAEIRREADAINGQIQNKIEECSNHFSQEEQNLAQMRKHSDDLEQEVNESHDNVNMAKEEERQLKRQIEHYVEQANERVEQIDEVEIKKKEEVYRLRTQISLHAHVTGIKWDYDDDIESMAGEIDIPSKQVQKRFEIDRENRSSFDVVNQVWTMMEA